MKAISVALFLLVSLAASLAYADTFGNGANTFDIEFITIGDPGNAPDMTGNPSPAGSVRYAFRMGKLEVSRDMVDKANADGQLNITLHDMTRYGGNGVKRPATGISWNEAARFVNWLNVTKGYPPAYKFAQQPGDSGYNADQDIELWNSGDIGFDPQNHYRNSDAQYFLPDVHEWYKAAYYDPTSGVYFDYPTGSDTPPSTGWGFPSADTAVYGFCIFCGPADVDLAGGRSPYGVMAMGGNVSEFNETNFNLVNNSTSGPRSGRGGVWNGGVSPLRSRSWGIVFSTTDNSQSGGFRVASVIPEPSTALLACASLLLVLRRRRGERVSLTPDSK